MPSLLFHGAAREVTGSMHLIECNGHRIALDCGLFQGRRAEAHEKNLRYPCDPKEIDAVILSHAHIDHSGRLPCLVRDGFAGPVFATPATRDLAEVMLADSAHIQVEDAAYFNKGRARHGEKPIEPLYGPEDAARCVRQFETVPHDTEFTVVPGVQAAFYQAGHMLGSAGVRVRFAADDRQPITLVYTGDAGRFRMAILNDPAPWPPCDYLICESTYGGRTTGSPEEVCGKLAKVLNETFERGGKVIVPAFAVGRTQALLYHFHSLLDKGEVRSHPPLFVDSPLAVQATEIFRRHTECYDPEAQALAAKGMMLGCPRCRFIRDVEESKALHERTGPLIIISASGMCETGRILHHLKNNCADPRNAILIVGFQAAHTLGRRLLEKARQIRIFGELYDVRARVHVINGLSAHADASELESMAAGLAEGCREAFLVHGEPDQSEALAARFRARGFRRLRIPARGERVELT